jgi:type-F conjugative transfer system pilin assembly protein TrbC
LEETKLLRALVFSIFFFSFSGLRASCPQDRACPARLQEQPSTEQFLTEDSLKIVEAMQNDKKFQSFLSKSLQKRDTVLEDHEFQNFVTTLEAQQSLKTPPHKPGEFYLFVSFSLGEKALLNLTQEAKAYGATLVLRGFIEGSYAKTAKALQNIIIKTGQGFIVDPELFSLFSITAVPTYILTKPFQLTSSMHIQTPIHDRIQGHVSIQYALEKFAKEGDLREEANFLLERGRSQ